MNFNGKVVLITGGAEKAGKIFALEFAKAGADIVISHCAMPQAAEQTSREITALGRRCLAVEADNRNIAQLQQLVRQTDAYFGRLDVLIHNASNFNEGPLEAVTEEMWDSSMEIILKGPFFLSHAAAPLMRKTGGKIIALIGNSYHENWPDFIPHSIAKTGLAKLMQLLAIALSPDVQCHGVCPASFLDSSSGDEILAARGETIDREKNTIEVGGIPLHRGNPREVAEVLLQLAASNAYLNGTIIPLDGGKYLI